MAKKKTGSTNLWHDLSFRQMVLALVAAALLVGAYAMLRVSNAAVQIKPQIAGVIDRHNAPTMAYQSVVNGWVVQANWADLQPTQGGPIAANNAIDQAISQARQLNQANPHLGMRLKLRIYGGIYAPTWAKNIGGAPFTIQNDQSGSGGTVGRFWLPAYGQAYQDLQTKLATKYDGVAEIREVVIDRCSTVFAEPFIREINVSQNVTNYRNAGYTEAADQQCQREEIDAHKVWTTTRSSLDVTPYQVVTANSTGTDEGFSEQMMVYCRSSLGARCVLGDNSLRSTAQSADFEKIFAKIKAMGPPIYFQTATADKIGDWAAALQKGIGLGAAMIELPAGYQNYSLSQLANYDNQLEAKAQTGTTTVSGGSGSSQPTSGGVSGGNNGGNVSNPGTTGGGSGIPGTGSGQPAQQHQTIWQRVWLRFHRLWQHLWGQGG